MIGTAIADLFAWEAFDSRGTPTVACEVILSSGERAACVVPSGASTGSHEATELRDGGERYAGAGVLSAIENINDDIRKALIGLDAADQRMVDSVLHNLDGSEKLSRLGANAVLAVSIGCLLAASKAAGDPLFLHVSDPSTPTLPMPMVNIISGGVHAGTNIDIQDVLVVPIAATSFAEAMAWCSDVRRNAASLVDRLGLEHRLVADEGGLGPRLSSNAHAIELVATAIGEAGLEPGVDAGIALDIAANELRRPDGTYSFATEGRVLESAELAETVVAWCNTYPIVSVEDPLGEDEWLEWRQLTAAVPRGTQIVGDDVFATQTSRLEAGIEERVANAILVKPNQVGTISGALRFLRTAQAAGYRTVISARSGDTEDTWLADLAVGWGCGQIKVGSMTRSERTAKWNRLLYIESRYPHLAFAGWNTVDPATGAI